MPIISLHCETDKLKDMGTLKNSVQLIGRPGMDPETKTFGTKKIVKFSLATNDYFYNDYFHSSIPWPRSLSVWGTNEFSKPK